MQLKPSGWLTLLCARTQHQTVEAAIVTCAKPRARQSASYVRPPYHRRIFALDALRSDSRSLRGL